MGLQLPILVGGSVIMENIFNLPGLGRLMLSALTDRDYPLVSGINLFLGTALMPKRALPMIVQHQPRELRQDADVVSCLLTRFACAA